MQISKQIWQLNFFWCATSFDLTNVLSELNCFAWCCSINCAEAVSTLTFQINTAEFNVIDSFLRHTQTSASCFVYVLLHSVNKACIFRCTQQLFEKHDPQNAVKFRWHWHLWQFKLSSLHELWNPLALVHT